MFCFINHVSSKMEFFAVSEIRAAAVSCKTAISCTSVMQNHDVLTTGSGDHLPNVLNEKSRSFDHPGKHLPFSYIYLINHGLFLGTIRKIMRCTQTNHNYFGLHVRIGANFANSKSPGPVFVRSRITWRRSEAIPSKSTERAFRRSWAASL
jgi:hypothetical protein